MSNDKKSTLAIAKRDIVDVVTQKAREFAARGEIVFPKNYAPENALKAAWITLQGTKDKSGNLVLATCTPDTIANALFRMLVLGLTPAKEQCYFVAYGKALTCMTSRWGWEALVRRVYPRADVFYECVYKDDDFAYEIVDGEKRVTQHGQTLGNVGGLDELVAAYCVIHPNDDIHRSVCEIMTIDQIEKAWARGENWPPKKGKMSAHTDHPEQFARKTVLARTAKRVIYSSDDAYLAEAVGQQTVEFAQAEVTAEAAEAGEEAEIIDIEPEEAADGDGASSEQPEAAEEPATESAGLTDEEKAEIAEQEREAAEADRDLSPSEQFREMIDEYQLDATLARRLAAERLALDDVRKLTNDHFAKIMDRKPAFLEAYAREHEPDGDEAAGGDDQQRMPSF